MTTGEGSPQPEAETRSLLRPMLILAGAHLLLMVAVFLIFGLGLEGPTIGGKILLVLGQPLLSMPGLGALAPALQNGLIPINSLVWGVALALALRAVRRRRSLTAGL